MERSYKEDLAELIKDKRPAIHIEYNDGTDKKFNYECAKKLYDEKERNNINGIINSFTMKTYYLADCCDFDFLQSVIKIGLVFDIKDIEKPNHIKETAKPLNNIVYYETKPVKAYLNGTKAKNEDIPYDLTTSGFLNYNEFVSSIEQYGIEYDGPKTFEEFYYNILCNVKSNITLSLNLKKEKEKALARRL